MGKTLLKVSLFSLVWVGAFIYVSIVLTEISGGGGTARPTGEVSPEAGKALFWGKGKCFTCHSFGSRGSAERGPNLGVGGAFAEPVAVRAAKRKPGMSAIRYIVESIYQPDVFVVPGFSKLMTPIHRPPIALSDEEIAAVISYLLSESGVEVGARELQEVAGAQAPYRTGQIELASAATGPSIKFPEGDPEEGKEVFQEMECFKCHKVAGMDFPVPKGEVGGVGPDLTGIGDVQTEEYLIESIVNPNAVIVRGEGYTAADGMSKMPEFAESMTVGQLQHLVAFLKSLKAPAAGAAPGPARAGEGS
ncbi:MAG: c-type cytochrome [Nitrospinota bacterium]